MTGGKDNDNEDENASNMDVSSFIFRGILQGEFVLDCFVEERVENDYEEEGDEAQEDRGDRGDLSRILLVKVLVKNIL